MILIFLLFLIGWILIDILNTYSQTMIQSIVKKDKLDIAMSSMIGLSITFTPLGAIFSGILSTQYSKNIIIIIIASLILGVTLFWVFNKNIRKLTNFKNLIGEFYV